MTYTLNSLSYDFGQRRANASIQRSDGNHITFMSVNFPMEPPANVSAADLNTYLIEAARVVLRDASTFTTGPAYAK